MLVVGLVSVGCGSNSPEPEFRRSGPVAGRTTDKPPVELPADPDEALFTMCRSGTVQLNGAADSIEETLKVAQKVVPFTTGESQRAFEEALELINGAGAGIADYTTPIPSLEEFKERLEEMDERRLKAIEAGNDAIRDLKEAAGILDSVATAAKDPVKQGAREVVELLDVCVQDLYDAVEALGGQVEE